MYFLLLLFFEHSVSVLSESYRLFHLELWLFSRMIFHLFQVPKQLIIIHFKITLVTHADTVWRHLTNLSFGLTADLTDRTGAPLAMPLWVSVEHYELFCKFGLTKLAPFVILAFSPDYWQIDRFWQMSQVFRCGKYIYLVILWLASSQGIAKSRE